MFKQQLRDEGLAVDEVFKEMHLTREEQLQLKRAQSERLNINATNLPEVDAENFIIDCRNLMYDDNPYLSLIALACLTGRRTAELLYTAQFLPPREKHQTHEDFWTEMTGICKQKCTDKNPLIVREIPLLERRYLINDCLHRIRQQLPCNSVAQVNRLYGKPIQRMMKKMAPKIGNIHKFRNMYGLTGYHYFNEENKSKIKFVSDVLAHKYLDSSVIPYMNFRVKIRGSLNFSH